MVAHLRKGETYAELGAGHGIGTTTVFRYVQEAIEVLAALAPGLRASSSTPADAKWKALITGFPPPRPRPAGGYGGQVTSSAAAARTGCTGGVSAMLSPRASNASTQSTATVQTR